MYLLAFIFLITIGVVYVSTSSATLLPTSISSIVGMFCIQGLGAGDVDCDLIRVPSVKREDRICLYVC